LKSYGAKAPTSFQTILSRKHVKQMSAYQESAIGLHSEQRHASESESRCTQFHHRNWRNNMLFTLPLN